MKEEKVKKRKPIWLRILIWVLSSILSLTALVGVGCGILYFKFQINVFAVINQVKVLNQEVNINNLAPNSYSLDDLANAKDITDANLAGLISYSVEDGYSITPENVNNAMTGELKFSDKQIGAIINNFIENQEELNVEIGKTINLKEHGFKIVEISFSNITETTADFRLVMKFNLTQLKEKHMNSFPINWVKNFTPETIYISATSTITKNNGAFNYSTEGKSLTINNLSEKDTASFLNTANLLFKLGSTKDFANTICGSFINLLIGNEETSGLTYSLKSAGATDFAFESDASGNYYVIKMWWLISTNNKTI